MNLNMLPGVLPVLPIHGAAGVKKGAFAAVQTGWARFEYTKDTIW